MSSYPSPEQFISLIQAARKQGDPRQSTLDRYRDLTMFDIHNRDVDDTVGLRMLPVTIELESILCVWQPAQIE